MDGGLWWGFLHQVLEGNKKEDKLFEHCKLWRDKFPHLCIKKCNKYSDIGHSEFLRLLKGFDAFCVKFSSSTDEL